MLATSSAKAMSAGLDPLPPDIATLYDAGQYQRAADVLQASVERNATDASLQYWLGRCFYEMRDFTRAISSFEQAVALAPDRPEYHDWLGRACGRKADENSHSNMAAALSLARRTHREFQAAVNLDAENVDAQRDLISFMANAPRSLGGGEENALEQIRALSSVDPAEGMLALANLYAVQKKFEQADAAYQKILQSTPGRVDVYFEVADYYRDRGDSERMDQAIESAAKIASSDRRLNYYRGVVLVLEMKDAAAAESDLRAYINTVPDNSELPTHSSAYEWLGKLFESEKRPDLAVEQYKAALALAPQNKGLQEALKRAQRE